MIREIFEGDRTEVRELLKFFPNEIQKNLHTEFEQALKRIISGYVYILEDSVSGYIVLRNWGGVYWLDTLVVGSNFQGRGIGKSLVDFAKEKCIKENIPQLNTCTFEAKTIPFYNKRGFVLMGDLNGQFMPLDKTRYYLRWRNC